MSAGNFKNHHVFVTGAAGFLGCRLITELLKQDAVVLGLDTKPVPETLPQSSNYRHITGELSSKLYQAEEFLRNVPVTQRGIFHMAGLADAEYCSKHPDVAFETNVVLTFNLLEMCRKLEGITFIFPSTGYVYGNRLGKPAYEVYPVYADSVYTSTKLAAEHLINSYSKNFSIRAVIARLSNVYGPGTSEKTVIGKLLRQVFRGEKLHVFDEQPVRDFIFLDDVIEALIRLYPYAPDTQTTIVNVSTGKGTPIRFVVDHACGVFSTEKRTQESFNRNKKIDSVLILSNEKLHRLTGWVPSISLPEGLSRCKI